MPSNTRYQKSSGTKAQELCELDNPEKYFEGIAYVSRLEKKNHPLIDRVMSETIIHF